MKFKLVLAVIIVTFVGIAVAADRKSAPTTNIISRGVHVANFANFIGKPAPDFTLEGYDGKTVSLHSLRGKKVALFFNEGIMCYPACWNQMAALGSDQQLNSDQIVTASIVPDSHAEWIEAVRQMPALGKETILLDIGNKVSDTYGVLNLPSSMHKGVKPGHTYVIIDQNGVVRYTYDDPNMGIQDGILLKELAKI